ncbi:MAG: L-lactate permease [Enterocloster bolteae]
MAKTYVILAPLVGMVGSFMTGSNMSSNILFGEFQVTTANLLHLNQAPILGAQTAGGSIGSAISPSNIILGTTTAGILGSEGQVLKRIIPFTDHYDAGNRYYRIFISGCFMTRRQCRGRGG